MARLLKTIALSLCVTLALPTFALAQEADDFCGEDGACRHIETYDFQGPDGESFSVEADIDLPWVAQGNVLLTPGEAVVIRLMEKGDALEPELVHTGDAARNAELEEGEIQFEFREFDTGSVVLVVHSAFPETLEYAALMVTLNGGPERTSVCTLMPGVRVFESWQAPIYQLALWSFRPTQNYSCSIIEMDAAIGSDSAS